MEAVRHVGVQDQPRAGLQVAGHRAQALHAIFLAQQAVDAAVWNQDAIEGSTVPSVGAGGEIEVPHVVEYQLDARGLLPG